MCYYNEKYLNDPTYLKKVFTIDSLTENEILFCTLCAEGLLEDAKWVLEHDKRINIHIYNEAPMRLAFRYNQEDVIFWLWHISKDINLNIHQDFCFRKACRNGNMKLIKWLLLRNNKIDMNACKDYSFRKSCTYGKLDTVVWLVNNNDKINIKAKKNDALINIFRNGHLRILEYLSDKFNIDLNYQNGLYFRIACENGHLNLAKYLFSKNKRIKVNMYLDYPFRMACINNHISVALWLKSYVPKYDLVMKNSVIVSFKYK